MGANAGNAGALKMPTTLKGTNPTLYSLTLVLIAVTSLQKYYTPHSNTATH